MKIKGIPVWEQYLEFIVLGIAALVFVGLTAMQFIGNPNAVEDPQRGMIGPGEVDEVLVEAAERIRPQLESDQPPVPPTEPQPVHEQFLAHLNSSVVDSTTLDIPQLALAPSGDYGVVSVDVAFVEPQIPAPRDIVTQQYFDALPDETVQNLPALGAMLPDRPYDVSWVTAAAMFDINTVLEEFNRSGSEGEPAAVPLAWYEGRVNIVDVVFEREERVEGGWTNLVTLEPMPGQFTLRERITSEGLTGRDRDQLMQALADTGTRLNIVQPEFYSTRNASWYPPTPADVEEDQQAAPEDLTEEQLRVRRLKEQLTSMRSELARVERRLEEAGGELYPDGKSSGGGAAGGAAGGGPPGGGIAGGALTGPDRQRPSQDRQRRQQIELTKRRDKLAEDITRVEQQLTDLGAQVQPRDTAQATDPFLADTMMLWGHDMTVEPGATYRYRVTVRILNPYFKRDVHLIEEQKDLAESMYMASQTSDWSAPIQAKPPLEAYITSANAPQGQDNAPGRLGLGQARIDVYRFYDGRWWKDDFTVEPGERIGGLESIRAGSGGSGGSATEIDFGTDWFVLDIVADLEGSDRARSRSNAIVLLQSITHPDATMWRNPADDADSRRRQELEEQVRSAELASADGAPAS